MRGKLQELRHTIKQSAPHAEERVSYGMPYYHYHGRLAYFGLGKSHLGLYIPPPVLQEHAKELKGYYAQNATLRLPLDEKLPLALIKKLIKARAKKNEAQQR